MQVIIVLNITELGFLVKNYLPPVMSFYGIDLKHTEIVFDNLILIGLERALTYYNLYQTITGYTSQEINNNKNSFMYIYNDFTDMYKISIEDNLVKLFNSQGISFNQGDHIKVVNTYNDLILIKTF